MSKLYKKYVELKEQNPNQLYLFHSGIFYIFLSEDATLVADDLGLKLTKFTDTIYKCGFPENSLTKYKSRLETLELEYEIVDEKESIKMTSPLEQQLENIKKLDINHITPVFAMNVLNELVEVLK